MFTYFNLHSSKRMAIAALVAASTLTAQAQQSNINLSHNPQKDTEGLVPFSAPLNSPEVFDDHTVIFRIKAPQAHEVKLSGAMLVVMGEKNPIPFTKGDDGIWTLKIGPLPVDMYQYNIVIDGVSTADPNNTYAAFTAMPPYSELIVHGDKPMWWDAQDVPHGSITRHIYHSSVTNGERDMYVYTPPTYNINKKYPVLYLMGGSGELPSNWMYDGRVNFIMDNLLAEGKAEEMIIAIINNQVVHRNHPQHADLTFDVMARELREVIVPFVDNHYSTIRDAHGRALSGLSMGGRHTIFSGMERNLDLFANFGVLSAGDNQTDKTMKTFFSTPNLNDKIDYLFIGQGKEEESNPFLSVRVKGLTDALNAKGVKHEYYAGGHGAHDWSTWRHLLHERFLPNVFKKTYNLTSGNAVMTIDAGHGGKITSLMVGEKELIAQHSRPATGMGMRFANMNDYGSTFWPSPQSEWNWPPIATYDSQPYTATMDGNTLVLKSGKDAKYPYVFEKQIKALGNGAYSITYIIHNESDAAVQVAPWEITRVASGGQIFFEAPSIRGDEVEYKSAKGIITVPFVAKERQNRKYFADAKGWLAFADNGLLFVKQFPDIAHDNAAPGEEEVEIYYNMGTTYTEIENQGAYTTIAPHETTSWTVRWSVAEVNGKTDLVKAAKKIMK